MRRLPISPTADEAASCACEAGSRPPAGTPVPGATPPAGAATLSGRVRLPPAMMRFADFTAALPLFAARMASTVVPFACAILESVSPCLMTKDEGICVVLDEALLKLHEAADVGGDRLALRLLDASHRAARRRVSGDVRDVRGAEHLFRRAADALQREAIRRVEIGR